MLAVGAAGPSASLVVPELLKRDVSVRAFVHKQEDEPIGRKLGVTDIVVGELFDARAVLKMPIVMTSSQEDHIQGPISPELQRAAPDAYKHRVKRVGIVNAWADPNFSGAIEATGRKNLIMGGVTTDICLVFPSISAVQLGYNVQAILDASGSSWGIQEEVTRQRMQQAGVVLTTTNTAIAELVQDWA